MYNILNTNQLINKKTKYYKNILSFVLLGYLIDFLQNPRIF